jgi:hypothetical protein
VTNPATITGDRDNYVMVFASPSGHFYRDRTTSLRLSGLSHLNKFIMTQSSALLTGTYAKTKSAHIKVATSHMRKIVCVSLFLLSLVTSGQKISFSQELLSTNDSEIIAIREFWKAYVGECVRNKDLAFKKYWNSTELEQGFTDIVNDELPVYSLGELVTFEIKKETNGFFLIRSKVLPLDPNDKTVYAIFNIYAEKQESAYLLHNQFFFTKSSLKHFQSGKVDFYYPENCSFSFDKAKKTADFYSNISTLYGYTKKSRITYIIGNTFNEANSFVGFDSSIISSTSPYAGYSIRNQNIILSCREDHLHEIVHAVFFPLFLKAPALFHEGIATYYGGTAGQSYSNNLAQLKKMINNKPDIDLSKIDDLNNVLDNGSNYFYTIGAIFIDNALKIGGPKKVLALFQDSVSDPSNWEDPFPAIKKEFGIEKDQIDSFLKKYVHDYKDN